MPLIMRTDFLSGHQIRQTCGLLAGNQNFRATKKPLRGVTFKDGSQSKCKIVCDLMHLEGAEALGEYAEDFYAGMPAVTRHDYGKGKLYYIGSCMEVVGTDKILSMAAEDARVNPVAENGNGLEIVKRNGEEKSFYFVMNFKDEDLKIPEEFAGKMDLLSGNAVEKGEMLPKFGVKILEE